MERRQVHRLPGISWPITTHNLVSQCYGLAGSFKFRRGVKWSDGEHADDKALPAHYNPLDGSGKSGDPATFGRNPYYSKVDAKGYELPYIDKINVKIAPTAATGANCCFSTAGEHPSPLVAKNNFRN